MGACVSATRREAAEADGRWTAQVAPLEQTELPTLPPSALPSTPATHILTRHPPSARNADAPWRECIHDTDGDGCVEILCQDGNASANAFPQLDPSAAPSVLCVCDASAFVDFELKAAQRPDELVSVFYFCRRHGEPPWRRSSTTAEPPATRGCFVVYRSPQSTDEVGALVRALFSALQRVKYHGEAGGRPSLEILPPRPSSAQINAAFVLHAASVAVVAGATPALHGFARVSLVLRRDTHAAAALQAFHRVEELTAHVAEQRSAGREKPSAHGLSADVHLSHVVSDTHRAEALASVLNRSALCSRPQVKLHAVAEEDSDADIREFLESAVESHCVAVLLSATYLRSCALQWMCVQQLAQRRRRPAVFPIVLEPCAELLSSERSLIERCGFDATGEPQWQRVSARIFELLSTAAGAEHAGPTPDVGADAADDDGGDARRAVAPRGQMIDASSAAEEARRSPRALHGNGASATDLFAEDAECAPVVDVGLEQSWIAKWGVRFERLQLGERIGAGGFGEVFKARLENGRTVAVKLLRRALLLPVRTPEASGARFGGTVKAAELELEPELLEDFAVEMRLASQLRHPNIVRFIGACTRPPELAIVMEYARGGSLYRRLERRRHAQQGPSSAAESALIALGIARGMEYLHAQYPVVIHRDLKSPNVLLFERRGARAQRGGGGTARGGEEARRVVRAEEVKLSDFGLARMRVASSTSAAMGGTAEWMAPELLRHDRFDESSDVFSFGVVLWELLTAQRPWARQHPMQVVMRVGTQKARLRLPSTLRAPVELHDMMRACFSEQPEQRPSANMLVRSLEYICQHRCRHAHAPH